MRRASSDHAHDALVHLGALRVHLTRGSIDDDLVLDAVCMRLAAAIDCLARLDSVDRDGAFGPSWQAIWATRNRIVHSYSRVDPAIVGATVENDLSDFESAVRRLAEPRGGH